MFFKQIKNFLPKKFVEGVALNLLTSQHSLSKLRGSKKQQYSKFSRYTKILLGSILALYFVPYQPVVSFPPVKQSIVHAEFSQNQSIDASHLSQSFNLPHPGYLTTSFSSWHPGVDIATGLGMPIHPVLDGKVIEISYGFWGLGHMVVVEHEQSFKSTYGHMGRIFVKTGDQVSQSSSLGEVGLTGHTSGPHTHLEITKNDRYIDPLALLPTMSSWPKEAGIAPSGQGAVRETQQIKPTSTPAPKTKTDPLKLLNINTQVNPQPRLPLLQLDHI